jgi:hypothetical protein
MPTPEPPSAGIAEEADPRNGLALRDKHPLPAVIAGMLACASQLICFCKELKSLFELLNFSGFRCAFEASFLET